jgi:hypothetical protein
MNLSGAASIPVNFLLSGAGAHRASLQPVTQRAVAQAVLAVERTGSPAVQPAVSRHVNLLEYLVIPVGAGLIMALALWLVIAKWITVYDWNNDPRHPCWWNPRQKGYSREFWKYSVCASGAWTASDSWATNLVTGFAVLSTILGTATATNSLFPGVAIDRFSILIVIAGGIAAGSPLLFGILYAQWTMRNPGVTPDASVSLCGTMWTDGRPRNAKDSADGRLSGKLEDDARKRLADGAKRLGRPQLEDRVPRASLRVPAGAVITSPGSAPIGAVYDAVDGTSHWPADVVKAGHSIQVPPGCSIYILSERDAAIALPGGSDVVVPGESTLMIANEPGTLTMGGDDATPADQSSGAQAKRTLRFITDGLTFAVIEDIPARGAQGAETQGAEAKGAEAKGAEAKGAEAKGAPKAKSSPVAKDVTLPLPLLLTAPAGAKITVAGLADLVLPAETKINAPRREKDEKGLADHRHIELPQGTNMLVGNMRLVTISALVTIFGIGAEIGIVGVLAVGLSDASTLGRWLAGVLLGLVAVFTLRYSKTAIGALANPQPGSSLSGSAGTSFTL